MKFLIRGGVLVLFTLIGGALGVGALLACVMLVMHITGGSWNTWTAEQMRQCMAAVFLAGAVLAAVFTLKLFRGEE